MLSAWLARGAPARLGTAQVRYARRRAKTVEVLLARDRPELGVRGDIVRVAPGFARHRLLPRGDAVRASLADDVAAVRANIEAEDAVERAALDPVVRTLESAAGLRFVRTPAGERGALAEPVSAAHVAAALARDFGVEVSAAAVTPATVASVGEHAVTVRLGRCRLPATVRLTVVTTAEPAAGTAAVQ
ncbi:hypothetical protein KFE25_004188 [Diacronema lutheri]|uniref:50S ribosomal protein L9, chloroplastic n=1 Tax=Diacronema lutheri TaxID=2081491 RepID=A0A8J6C043_DIALT|nr:hypothetical protein KFE25_004188 [Diacronema lutheri]